MPRKQAYSYLPVKKTGGVNQKMRYEDKFISVTTTPLIALQHEKLSKRLNNLSKVLVRHSFVWNRLVPSQLNILKNYLQYYYQYYEFDQFDATFEILPSLDVNLYTVSNQELIYKSFNLFHNSIWPVRFHSKFVAKVSTFGANQIKYVLSFVMMLSQGHFYGKGSLKNSEKIRESKIRNDPNLAHLEGYGYVVPVNTKCIPHNRFFYLKLFREKNLLFSVGVQKIPIVKSGIIKRYQYANYIQMLDILSDHVVQNPQKLDETVQRFVEYTREDVAKRDHSDELVIDSQQKNKKKQVVDHMFVEILNPYINQNEVFATQFQTQKKYDYRPLIFKPHYVSMSDTSTLIFDKNLKRWVSNDYLTKLQQKALNEYQRKVNQELIKRFVDFQSAKTLVQLLTKIPNFRVELTQQEKDVIGENGNVLVIGRSGTGKTTCAVLRLFAIEMLFKIRLSLSKKKHQQQLKDTRCSADDIDKTMGLHCVFLTASPVLTNQIERYYKKLTDNIKLELQKKKKKVQQQRKKQQQIQRSMKKRNQIHQQSAQEIQQLKEQQIVQKGGEQSLDVPQKLEIKKSKQVMEQQQQMNKELGGIQLDQKIENEQFQEDEENYDEMKDQLDQKMKKFKSLFDLRQQDYPGFFTVKSFIMMIDGTLPKPFFIRKQADANQQQSQATWHNEKKGVMMIENYYRGQNDEKDDEKVQQEIEEEINYSDQEELEHEYLRQIQLRQNKQKQKLTDKLKKNKKSLSFQVDYDYFLTYFWPNVRHKHYSARNITAHLVWTEIYSTIKGGASAHLYPGFYMTQKAYMVQSTNSFLTKQQKLDVYETFCQYERWKINSGGYDMMDAVNYILNFTRFRGYSGPQIHYVMIDEVQDLPHSIVYLLSKTVRYGVFYSGDTAQTIAKGVGFRFCDLKNLFDSKQFDYSLQLNKPVVKQLTVNFRSHNNILQLANSVVSSIEILFPKTIDRLKKQVSNLKGPKPMILSQGDQELLFYVLCGDQSYKKTSGDTEQGLKKPPLEFGCDQVIIVRDQESKSKIPGMLQHALCLTIYEAKGLEFNDVILFNFFAESKCADKWNLIKYLKVVINQIDAQEYEKTVTKHIKDKEISQKEKFKGQPQDKQIKQQEPEELDVECIVENKDNKVNIKKIVSDAKIVMKDINDYAELCSELKMLYTAITRPKNTLIIYDEDSTARKTIQKLWEKLEVIEVVSKQLLEESNKKQKPESQQLKIFKSIVNSTDKSQWKKQGMKMYSRGYFEQAMKCFERSGHQELYKKSQANNMADMATKKLIQIQSQRNAIKNKLIQYQKMSESDLSKLKKKLKKEESATFLKFEQAGQVFEDLLMFKQAGQCYFSGRQYQKAYENFSKAFMNKQAAQSLQMLNKFRQAAEYYEKQGSYLKVIQCLDMINQWELILRKIQKFSNEMTDLEKKSLFKKYSALALQQLVYQIQFENEPEENKPENNRVEIIKEQQDSQQEDWNSDQDPELAAQRQMSRKSSVDSQLSSLAARKLSNLEGEHETKRKQSLIQEQKIIQQSVYENVIDEKNQKQSKPSHQENIMQSIRQQPQQKMAQQNGKNDQSSFADLNSSNDQQNSIEQKKKDVIMQSIYDKKQQKMQQKQEKEKSPKKQQQNKNDVSGSFAELNSEQSSFADLNSENENYNTKYPTQLEPDIQSIKSLADPEDPWLQSALSQIRAKTNTQYSIIDEQQNYNPNVRIIKTRGNIVVQDQIMRKIIGIVSIVNQSVDQFFKQFKGYQSLITVDKTTENLDTIDNRPEISEFEDVDPKFINIILDTLQSFKLYKLCLFVCNRYHLPHKAGRYLVSMALKYATNPQINNTLNPALIAPSLSRKSQLQKGILASIALHAMFENVSSDFLKVKVHQLDKQEAKNSLGSYFIQGLILQGLYKKTVFIVNPQQSLRILRNFCDNEVYQQVYKQKFQKKTQQQPAQFLDYAPKSRLQEEYTIVKLQQQLYRHNIINRLQTISHRFYKQFNVAQIKNKHDPTKIKSYTPLLASLLGEDKNKITESLNANIGKGYQYMENGPDYKIFDTVAFLTTAINSQHTYKYIFELKHSEFLDLLACLRTIRRTLRHKNKSKSYEIIQSVLTVYNCRMIDPCKSSKFINDGYAFVHRTSIICNQFVEELKKNKNQTAFFFQQDYNYILVRTSKLIDIVAKRFDLAYSKFIRNRIDIKLHWVDQLNNQYLGAGFQAQQSQFLIKALLRQQYRLMHPKDKKNKKQSSTVVKKPSKPSFNFKAQGRPELVIDLDQSPSDNQSHEDKRQHKSDVTNFFIFPDLNSKFKFFSDLSLSAFNQKLSNNVRGKMISGRLLYCCGLNDSYKEYISQKGDSHLYDAIQFRKFNRLDMYADNILPILNDLSYSERHLFSAQLLIHLMIQYKCLVNGKNFKLDVPRKFLRFLPNLKLIEVIGVQGQVKTADSNQYLSQGKHVCAFGYNNLYSCDYQKNDISEVICEILQILKEQQSFKCYNIQKFILLLILNMPNDKQIYNSLRQFLERAGYNWENPILMKIRGASNYEQFVSKRQKVLDDKQFMKNCQILHEVRVTNKSNIDKDITESENDYEIKEKIQQARAKAVKKICLWWRTMRKKGRPSDQIDILKENRLVKMTHRVKYLPLDDRFLLRSSTIRDVLLSFYLRNIVTSSLDYHFILMTLNKIEDLRKTYIKAYSSHNQGIVELNEKQIDFEEEIANIQSTIQIWKNDSKWIKDRNIDLKRKKVFQVKWMTKNNMHKIVKKRAGIQKQKKLQIKKQLLKRRE